MKARVIEETPYSPNLKAGMVVEIVPGMETDSEGHQAYMFPSCLQVLMDEQADVVAEFRKEATLRFASAILSNPRWCEHFEASSRFLQFEAAYFKANVIGNAMSYADALIEALGMKKEQGK